MNSEQPKMTEKCDQQILNSCFSQKVEILKELESAKQEEKETKEFLENQEKKMADLIKKCHDLMQENETLKQNSLQNTQLRNEIVKTQVTTEGLMNKTAENYNSLENTMQILINDQHETEIVKNTVLNDSLKLITKKDIEHRTLINQLKDTSDYIDQLKYQRSKNVEYYDTIINNNMDEIIKTKQDIIQLQTHITDVNQEGIKLYRDYLNDLTKEIFELQIKFNVLNEQKEVEDIEYDEFQKLEVEFNDWQNSSIFLKELKIQKITVGEKISALQSNCVKTETEIKNLEEQLQKERDDNQINILNNNIEELERRNRTLEIDNVVLEKELSKITNEENSLNTDINDLLAVIKDLEAELKQQEDLSEEQCLKAEKEIDALLVEETIVDAEEQELIDKYKEINEECEMMRLQNEAVAADAEIQEIMINDQIDSLKNAINKEKHEIQEKQEEISKIQMNEKKKIEQLHKDYEKENEKLVAELKDTQIKLNELYKKEKIKSDEFRAQLVAEASKKIILLKRKNEF